jgi:hypothetical protein
MIALHSTAISLHLYTMISLHSTEISLHLYTMMSLHLYTVMALHFYTIMALHSTPINLHLYTVMALHSTAISLHWYTVMAQCTPITNQLTQQTSNGTNTTNQQKPINVSAMQPHQSGTQLTILKTLTDG